MNQRIPSSGRQHTPEFGRARAEDVHRFVLYFDIFRHPLRVDELERLIGPGAELAVAAAAAEGRVERDGRWVFRQGRGGDRARRQERSAEAERQWPRVRRVASLLAALPYVRGVLLTGGHSKQSAEPGGDIDFMLLTTPGRVWTLKGGLHGFRRVLPSAARELLCANYLLSTDALALPTQTMFHAMELATAVPMAGPEACGALLDANPWAARYVPGLAWSRARAAAAPPVAAWSGRAAVEALTPEGLDTLSARALSAFWERRYSYLSNTERQRRFRREKGAATNHLHDFSAYVNGEFASRCNAEGVPLP